MFEPSPLLEQRFLHSTEAHITTLRWFYRELKRGNFDAVGEVYAPDYISHNFDAPDGERPGLDAAERAFRTFYTAFPDHEILEEVWIGEGDLLVHRIRYQATQRGDFYGIPATNKHVTVSGVDIYRFSEGRVVEKWSERDRLSLLLQLGYTVQPESPR